MTVDTIYELTIKYLTKGFRVYFRSHWSDPRNAGYAGRTQLFMYESEHFTMYEFQWDNTFIKRGSMEVFKYI